MKQLLIRGMGWAKMHKRKGRGNPRQEQLRALDAVAEHGAAREQSMRAENRELT